MMFNKPRALRAAIDDLDALLKMRAQLPPGCHIRAEIEDHNAKIVELVEQSDRMLEEALAMQDKFVAEGNRRATDEEAVQLTNLNTGIRALGLEVERRKETLALQALRNAPQPRRTTPTDAPREEQRPSNAVPQQRGSQITGGAPSGSSRATFGFSTPGDFYMAVRRAGDKSLPVDPRLLNAPTTFGSEANGEDGAYAIPPEFRTEIVKKVSGEGSLLSLTDQLTTTGNSMTIPVDRTTPWGTSGITASWVAEAGLKPQVKPELGQVTVRTHKIVVLAPMTDELLEDAPGMASYLKAKVPDVIGYKVNNAIINGTGVGTPLGIMNGGALVTVDEETSQANATVVPANISKMWGRLAAQYRSEAVWLINQDVEAAFDSLALSGSAGGLYPVYLPPGGFSESPYARLKGRPVIVTEALPTLGQAGDILLVNLKQYLTLQKAGGMKSDISIHLFFDYDVSTFRFVLRIGGQPWWDAPIARAESSNTNTLSPFVALGARVT